MIRSQPTKITRRSFWDIQMQRENPNILAECNSIKYAAYRMAAKLRILQRILCMENIRLGLIANVFDRHHLHRSENDVELEYTELEAVLYDIFFAAEKESQCTNNIDTCTATMVQFLLDVFDTKCHNTVSVISAKVCLAVLSSSKLQEKYQYFFHQYSDHNNCISKKKFVSFLTNVTQITEFLSETNSFGNPLIPATVDNCFKNSLGPLGLAEHNFINWLIQEPQLLVWLSTLYRLQSAESVYHDAKCSVCKMYPIKGLRYHCLRCLAYDQCQTCFFTGKLSKRHKLLHPMEEHCSQSSSRENALTFLKILKNKLCRTKTSTKLHYLPVQAYEAGIVNRSGEHFVSICGKEGAAEKADSELGSLTIVEGLPLPRKIQPYTELQSIICHLEQDNRLLNDNIATLLSNDEISCVGEYLQDHRALVETQVKRLKQLKQHLLQMYPPHAGVQRLREPLESTPVLPTHRIGHRGALDEISPIMKQLDETRVSLEQKKLPLTPAYRPIASETAELPSLSEVTAGDISTWVGNGAAVSSVEGSGCLTAWMQETKARPEAETTITELHEDLDQILDRLQKMLASNFSLEDSFSGRDNTQLQITTAEIEDLLSGLVEGVAKSKSSSLCNASTEK